MTGFSRDQLLQPSLDDGAVATAPYSIRTTFLTAFFGGPLAAIAIVALNTLRLRRVWLDLAPLGLVLAAFLAFMLALQWTEWGANLGAYLNVKDDARPIVFVSRAIAIAIFGLGYALHRKEQRSADLMGLRRPNGWIAGIACIAGGILLSVTLAELVASGKGP